MYFSGVFNVIHKILEVDAKLVHTMSYIYVYNRERYVNIWKYMDLN